MLVIVTHRQRLYMCKECYTQTCTYYMIWVLNKTHTGYKNIKKKEKLKTVY